MVLAVSEAVKRRYARKIELPNKTSVACGLCSQSVQRIMEMGQIVPAAHLELARLYTNGIVAAKALPTFCIAADRTATMSVTPTTIRLTVNGNTHDVAAAPDTALLYVLRNDLELNGPKYGCGLGECGACAVIIDGVAARSCVIPISGCVERGILTLEGLGSRHHPDPVQAAFIEEQAAQCGYCLNGMIMTTKALLLHNPQPSEAEVQQALQYNLCRCGAHVEILRAVMRAAGYAVGDSQ